MIPPFAIIDFARYFPKLCTCLRPLTRYQPKGIPYLISATLYRGVAWKRPSGPRNICSLLIHCLFWPIRTWAMAGLRKPPSMLKFADKVRASHQRRWVSTARPTSARGDSKVAWHVRLCPETSISNPHVDIWRSSCCIANCFSPVEMTCSKCKTVRYCGRHHQAHHWKNLTGICCGASRPSYNNRQPGGRIVLVPMVMDCSL